jgi:1,4-dihydroxy-2-naphthoyl-CoA hydrolase
MSIWFQPYTVSEVGTLTPGNMAEYIGIRITEVGDDYLRGTMPVDHRTRQPAGILHGGASVALAETLGSIAAYMTVDRTKKTCVGLEINANHIRCVREGEVTGTARPLHIGSSTQVWSIEITDVQDKLVCVSRITIAVLERKS